MVPTKWGVRYLLILPREAATTMGARLRVLSFTRLWRSSVPNAQATDAGRGQRVTPPVPSLAHRVGLATSAALVIYFPPVALPITGNVRVACLSLVKRSDTRPHAQKAPGKNGFVHISQCSFEFRLGAGIIGSSKNRSNSMQIINFDLGARIVGTIGHFVVSLEAPSYYKWAPAYYKSAPA